MKKSWQIALINLLQISNKLILVFYDLSYTHVPVCSAFSATSQNPMSPLFFCEKPSSQVSLYFVFRVQVDVMAAVLPKIATVFCSLFVLLATETTSAFKPRIFTSFPLQCHTFRLLFTLVKSFHYVNYGLSIMDGQLLCQKLVK